VLRFSRGCGNEARDLRPNLPIRGRMTRFVFHKYVFLTEELLSLSVAHVVWWVLQWRNYLTSRQISHLVPSGFSVSRLVSKPNIADKVYVWGNRETILTPTGVVPLVVPRFD